MYLYRLLFDFLVSVPYMEGDIWPIDVCYPSTSSSTSSIGGIGGIGGDTPHQSVLNDIFKQSPEPRPGAEYVPYQLGQPVNLDRGAVSPIEVVVVHPTCVHPTNDRGSLALGVETYGLTVRILPTGQSESGSTGGFGRNGDWYCWDWDCDWDCCSISSIGGWYPLFLPLISPHGSKHRVQCPYCGSPTILTILTEARGSLCNPSPLIISGADLTWSGGREWTLQPLMG